MPIGSPSPALAARTADQDLVVRAVAVVDAAAGSQRFRGLLPSSIVATVNCTAEQMDVLYDSRGPRRKRQQGIVECPRSERVSQQHVTLVRCARDDVGVGPPSASP